MSLRTHKDLVSALHLGLAIMIVLPSLRRCRRVRAKLSRELGAYQKMIGLEF